MSRQQELFVLEDCHIEHETDAAVCVARPYKENIWIPFSQIDRLERNTKLQYADKVYMTVWIARQKGLL